MKMDNKRCIVLLGNGPGGLFLARQFRKEWPSCIIYMLGDPQKDFGQFSNTINGFYPAHSADELCAAIERIVLNCGGVQVDAYICSNPMLEWVVSSMPVIFNTLHFENQYSTYQQLADKASTESLCQRLGVRTPRDYDLSISLSEQSINYPVVVKPLVKMETIGLEKCKVVNSDYELELYLEKADWLGVEKKYLICQQYIPGDNRWEYGYGGYFQDGVPKVDIAFYQFRQAPQGLCCFAREVTDPISSSRVKEFVRPILEELRYNGFIEFDIKQCPYSDQLYLLDINPRPWRSVDMLSAKLGNSTVWNPEISDGSVQWRYPFRELFCYSNSKSVPYKVCRAMASAEHIECCRSLFDRQDGKPYRKQRRHDWSWLLKVLLQKLIKIDK